MPAQTLSPAPLAGHTIVVTRPAHQAEALVAAIEAAGGTALRFPFLDIAPVSDPARLQQAAATLASFALAVFISPNAVHYSLPVLLANRPWPRGTVPAAIGPGTVAALATYGLDDVVVPSERFDSEGLLAEPALQSVAGVRIAIFRGDGGRDLLGDTLIARGAEVDYIPCYTRKAPSGDLPALVQAILDGAVDALTVSSSEGLRHFVAGLGADHAAVLARVPLFAPHPRIIEVAERLGFRRTQLTGPADAGLLAGLCAYNWPSA